MQRFVIISLCIVSLWASPFENRGRGKLVPFREIGPRIINGEIRKNQGPRIINGDKAARGQFPWQVAINVTQAGTTNLCGGALISDRWVLTAGHCVQSASAFIIQLGSTLLSANDPARVTLTTNQYIQHEEYSPFDLANDIAVIPLPRSVTFNDVIQPIPLTSTDTRVGTIVTVSGWGLTSDSNDVGSPDLNYVDLVTVSDDVCRNAYGFLNEGVFCSGSRGSVVQSTCEGDSGGPLVTGFSGGLVHVGVVSFGHGDGCESGNPAGFTSTFDYRDWIREKTGV